MSSDATTEDTFLGGLEEAGCTLYTILLIVVILLIVYYAATKVAGIKLPFTGEKLISPVDPATLEEGALSAVNAGY